MQEITIPTSKLKTTLIFLGCLFFVLLGTISVKSPEMFSRRGHPVFIEAVGTVMIMFFGYIMLHLPKKILSNKPGLTISKRGILDNSGIASEQLILWEDIQEIKLQYFRYTPLIMFKIKNTRKYLPKSIVQRVVADLSPYKSIYSINVNSLKISPIALESLIVENFKEFRTTPNC